MLEFKSVNWGTKPFRRLDIWFSHPSFTMVVKNKWKRLDDMGLSKKLKKLEALLRCWNLEVLGNIDFNINMFNEKEFSSLNKKMEERVVDDVMLTICKAPIGQLELWYDKKNEFWKNCLEIRC